jgi:niacin transporter
MTNISNKIKTMTIAALLSAIGFIIPAYSPFKVLIEPASFTLGSHIAIMIAMFISPLVGVTVALITSFGFLMSGLPLIVVLRALTHVVFVTLGALILKKNGNVLLSLKSMIPFALLISAVHAACEVIVASVFYFNGTATKSYLVAVIGLVGVGTLIHSLVDFSISVAIWKPLQYVIHIPASAKIKVKAK